ncbi:MULTISPECIES: helix-turn-helix domain-containing protein [Burkholderia]|uniref:helix-turn-helix domain-containing protein n=1 Tax=Burkholderia TaxID=32008 RepID=UPI00157B0E04|nr:MULTISPECIES: helix-turn-helix transcriptional regulator [Burkholderia]MBW5286359.1 helix-turn-helix transcriptional regulator [Burkholderia gladioli]MDF3107668.1 helix-turn-helix transcriptional regulator [Burkholderia semiarida]MDR8068237.1 helix-turn-helix transcriptional regulator [Burkholderia cenocepacia]
MKNVAEHEALPLVVVMEIGRAVKVCRSAKKLSLDELAERAGLSQSYLSMIESGKREPTLSSIEKVSTALGVPTPILLFLAAEKDELKGLDEETSRRLAEAVLDVVRG